MIGTNLELYSEVRSLANIVAGVGRVALAAELEDALATSTVTGEVLSETRQWLLRVRATDLYGRVDVRQRVDEALRYLTLVLGPPR